MTITDDNFTEVLTNNELVVLDFGATWCAPCRALAPIISTLITNNAETPIGKIDIDENPILTAKYGIRSIPTLIYIKNGEIVDKQSGVPSLKSMQDKIDSFK